VSPHVSPEVEDWQESRWPPLIAILIAGALYILLPDRLILGGGIFGWVIPGLEVALIVVALMTTPRRESNARRDLGIALAVLITVANGASLIMLIVGIATEQGFAGHDLVWAGIDIWVTNAIIFAVWYWEMDGGGPRMRAEAPVGYHDFLFPQFQISEPWTWRPQFLDYLFVAFTNAASFAPADTLPMTTRAKALMSLQSLISLAVILIVAARAINVLH
jgi:uncharacterized membrane protein